MCVDGPASSVTLVLVTHAHRAATALSALRTMGPLNHIGQLRIPSCDPRQGLRTRVAGVPAFTFQRDHELTEVVGESFDLQDWPRWDHVPKFAESGRGASIQFAGNALTVRIDDGELVEPSVSAPIYTVLLPASVLDGPRIPEIGQCGKPLSVEGVVGGSAGVYGGEVSAERDGAGAATVMPL